VCAAAVCAFSAVAAAAPNTYTGNIMGKFDDFDFELWSQRETDDVSMTLTGGGTFECRWENVYNALFRMGKKLGSVASYAEYGDVTVEYSAEHNITKGDVSYLCVYGWTQNPLREFYIVESYGNYKPPGGKGFKGTIVADGGVYDVYTDTRTQQPSIEGTRTFEQYFSVRRDKRAFGTITVSDHFKAWEALGLDMSGAIYEVALCVEGFGGSGNAAVLYHSLTAGDDVYYSPYNPSTEEPSASGGASAPASRPQNSAPAQSAHNSKTPSQNSGASSGDGYLTSLLAGLALLAALVGVLVFFSKRQK
jgi:hypothetical protein